MKGFWLSKTLMDGGSSINILYFETFQRMGLKASDLIPTSKTFHGIVPGKKAFPIGRVILEVAFGDERNFRKEKVAFEVVTFKSAYHCVLGRQAFAKFMAVPHYAYNKLKIPGPNGVITVCGDAEKAVECEKKGAEEAEAVLAAEAADELAKLTLEVDPNDSTVLKRPTVDVDAPSSSFKAAQDTKSIDLVEGDSSKQVLIGAGLDRA